MLYAKTHDFSRITRDESEVNAMFSNPRFEFCMRSKCRFVALCHQTFAECYIRLHIAT